MSGLYQADVTTNIGPDIGPNIDVDPAMLGRCQVDVGPDVRSAKASVIGVQCRSTIRTRKGGGCRPRVPVRADRVQIDGEEVKTRRFALKRAMPDVAAMSGRRYTERGLYVPVSSSCAYGG